MIPRKEIILQVSGANEEGVGGTRNTLAIHFT